MYMRVRVYVRVCLSLFLCVCRESLCVHGWDVDVFVCTGQHKDKLGLYVAGRAGCGGEAGVL